MPSSRRLTDWLRAARGLRRAARHEQAADLCTRALRRHPGCAQLLRDRSEALRCLGREAAALKDLDRLVRLEGGGIGARLARGAGRRRVFDFQGAVRDAEAALTIDPGSAEAWTLAAEGWRNLGRTRKSLECSARAIALKPAWSWARVVRAKARRMEDLRGALADVRAASAIDPRDAKARAWRGEILRRLGRFEAALDSLNRALELDPGCAWARVLRGETLRDLGRGREGLADVVAGVRQERGWSPAHDFLGREPALVRSDRTLAWMYGCRGAALRKKKSWSAALADLDRAVRLDGRCFWARAWRGELRLARGEFHAALPDLRKALTQCPEYADAHVWLGRALCGSGRCRAAVASYARALALQPDHVWALLGAGVCSGHLQKTTARA